MEKSEANVTGFIETHRAAGWETGVIAAGLGFFAVVAQAVLFRDFIGTLEGSELGVGVFFGTWLAWVGLGAVAGRSGTLRKFLARYLSIAALAYPAAFIVQYQLLLNARRLAGVPAYEIYPLVKMFLAAGLLNAPVSFLTGLFFTAVCEAAAGRQAESVGDESGASTVSKVYVWEALGSFAGGVGVTLGLASGVPGETVAAAAAGLLTLAAAVYGLFSARLTGMRRRDWAVFAAPVAILFFIALGGSGRWVEANRKSEWVRLLPEDAYSGWFATSQGEYLYGERDGQFIVTKWGSTVTNFPGDEAAGAVAAANVSQRPEAQRVLVYGTGSLPVCRVFAKLDRIREIAWLSPDPEYPMNLLKILPERLRDKSGKIRFVNGDFRDFLSNEENRGKWDIVVIALPDITSLSLNRYATVEFFQQARACLARGGMLSVRVSGGANYLGGEISYLGASMLYNLKTVFDNISIQPGDDTRFFCSDAGGLSDSAAVLRSRWKAVPGGREVYPPEGFSTLFPLDRVTYQMAKYEEVFKSADRRLLENSDSRPKALLYGLAVSLKKAGASGVSKRLPGWSRSVLPVGILIAVIYFLLRAAYLRPRRPGIEGAGKQGRHRKFDAYSAIFTAGAAGMTLSVVLMFGYQSRFGTLYLHVGLAAALFMLGLFFGGAAAVRVARLRVDMLRSVESSGEAPGSDRSSPAWLSLGTLAFFIVVAAAVSLTIILPGQSSRWVYAGVFLLSGAGTGVFFPPAAEWLRRAGGSDGVSGASLELADHLGGAVGGVLAGVVLIPLAGVGISVGLAAGCMAAALLPSVLTSFLPRAGADSLAPYRFDRFTRTAGYWMLGTAVFFLVSGWVYRKVSAESDSVRLETAAREMAGGAGDIEAKTFRPVGGKETTYFAIRGGGNGGVTGYVFPTAWASKAVFGYGGGIDMAVFISTDGELNSLRLIRHAETPAYVRMTKKWRKDLIGRNIFRPDGLKGVDAVSGATMTCGAILDGLRQAGARFAVEALGKTLPTTDGGYPFSGTARLHRFRPDSAFLVLVFLTAGVFFLRLRPVSRLRPVFLLLVFAVAGAWLNMQFSTQQVFALAAGKLPAVAMTGTFFLAVGVPLLVLLFGNFYCGWLCPFGALQELVGDIAPRKWKIGIPKMTWRYGRAVKYVMLWLLAVIFAWSWDYRVLAADVLVPFFGGGFPALPVGLVLIALAAPFSRFWCRNLCPAAAFLSLLNRVSLFRKLFPPVRPKRCDLGVRNQREMDCIGCDRCRGGGRESNS